MIKSTRYFLIGLLLFCMNSLANPSFYCPTTQQLISGDFLNWQVLNTLNDEIIPFDKAWDYFKEHLPHNFWIAQWVSDLIYQAQCYYCVDEGCKSNGTGYSDFYLARTDSTQPSGGLWQNMSLGDKRCESNDVLSCLFSDVTQIFRQSSVTNS